MKISTLSLDRWSLGSDKVAKIVNNFEAYIVAIMKSENALMAKVGDRVSLQFAALEPITTTIEKIVDLEKGERMIFFKMKRGIEATINYRKLNVDVIWWSSTGLKVPNSSIITENGFNFVIRNRAGYKDKIMVKVLKQNASYSIIGNYETADLKEMGYSSTEIRSFKKISMYDEIFLRPAEE